MGRAIRVGCVPEHFSSPLHLAHDRGLYAKHGVEVELVTCPSGTGQMVKMLRNGELDVACALTEGLVAMLARDNDDAFRIIGTYVDAPLTWAISAGASSPVSDVGELRGGRIGVSRMGSGSHIMSIVLAQQRGWLASDGAVGQSVAAPRAEPFDFVILGDFAGLRDGVNADKADAFMWETFTSKPFHDGGVIKRVGQITTPWPAFMLAARTQMIGERADEVRRLGDAVSEACGVFMQERDTGKSQEYVASTFAQRPEDVEEWFKTVKYAGDVRNVSIAVLEQCVRTLQEANVVTGNVNVADLIDKSVVVQCE